MLDNKSFMTGQMVHTQIVCTQGALLAPQDLSSTREKTVGLSGGSKGHWFMANISKTSCQAVERAGGRREGEFTSFIAPALAYEAKST